MLPKSDVIIEFYRVGTFVKVSAVDPHSYTEVCVIGDPTAGEEIMARTALRKLQRSMTRIRPANRR